MKAAILALQFMTRLPLPGVAASEDDFGRAIRWFPLAGALIGLLVAGVAWLGLQRDPWLAALGGLCIWVGVTGALHLDGLGDIADARGAAHADRTRLLAVLADPHIGSFGVTAITLQLATKLVLLHLALEEAPVWSVWSLAAIPFAARIGPLLWTLILPPLHAGLGTRFGAGANWPTCLFWFGVLGVVAWWLCPALMLAPLAMALCAAWIRKRLGGISGDGHGAGIELVESALLLALVLAP